MLSALLISTRLRKKALIFQTLRLKQVFLKLWKRKKERRTKVESWIDVKTTSVFILIDIK